MNEYRDDLVKLMCADGTTRDGTAWGDGVTHTAKGNGTIICTSGVIHAYRNKEQAAFLSSAHGIGYYTLARRASGTIVADDGTKIGCKTLTTHELIDLPKPTLMQRVYAAIRCSQSADTDRTKLPTLWHQWGNDWISGKDRSIKSAWKARLAANDNSNASRAAIWAAEASRAAIWAAEASQAAIWAAEARAAEVIESATRSGVNIQPILEAAMAWKE